ncbi:MAG TPA: hypothetical protein VJR89_08195, partial [Polyangiales bacterium]|nr:hypothetical protein [Polyangiales bacterium]
AVQRGVVCYRDGQFQVHGDLAQLELPHAYDDAILARVQALSPTAREALGALSLLTPFGALSPLEHLELFAYAGWSRADALAVLDELRDAQLLKARAAGYELHSEAVRRLASAALGAAGARLWHERIGSYYQSCGHARGMLAALHLEYAGERQRAYEQLLPLDAQIHGMDDPNIPLGGSTLGIALHQAMRDHAVRLGRRSDEIHFRRILLELAATSNPSAGADGMDLLRQLCMDAGLDLWACADDALDEGQKLLYCLARGQQRYLATPEAQRGMPVRDAVRLLAQCASVLATLCALTFDRATMAELFRIFEPLRNLSPVLTLTYRQLENSALGLTLGGRMTPRWLFLLRSLQTRPDGMRELIWRYVVSNLCCHIGREAATFGEESYRSCAEELERSGRRQRQALSLHLLYALAHGRFEEFKRLRRELEIATVASNHEDQLVVFAYIAELELLEACGDLLELQRLSTWFDARASRYPGWKPFAAIARAACLLQCDRPDAAEAVLAAHLDAAPVLEHAAWYWLRALRAEANLLAGNLADAREQAEEVIERAAAAKLDMRGHTRAHRVLSLASAALGDDATARHVLEPLLRGYATNTTVRAGLVFEAAARVALFCEDEAAYARYVGRVRDVYAPGGYPGLLARLERLHAAGRRAFELEPSAPSTDAFTVNTVQSASLLEAGSQQRSREERVPYLLSLLIADGRASAGKLYSVAADGGVRLVHTESALLGDAASDRSIADYVAHLTSIEADATRVESLDSPNEGIRRLDDACALVPLRDYHGILRGVALLQTQAGSAKLVCSPALCSMVADALAMYDS